MQIEITLHGAEGYSARDLGYLLHKHPDHLHERETAAGRALVFFPESTDERTRAVLFLDVDPVALVRGRAPEADGLLTQYVNDRPYTANSFLSVALEGAAGTGRPRAAFRGASGAAGCRGGRGRDRGGAVCAARL